MSDDPRDYSLGNTIAARDPQPAAPAAYSSFEERIARLRSSPDYAAKEVEKRDAERVTSIRQSTDWQMERRAEQEAAYAPPKPQRPLPNPRSL